jgi:hypothetical protein
MEQALLIIEQYQTWIYLVLALAGLTYLRLTLRWYGTWRRAMFGLERDHAAGRLTRSLAMLSFVALVALGTFLVATFLVPAVPLAARPTPLPTISLLLTVTPLAQLPAEAGTPGAAAPAPATPDQAGCLNPSATITSPLPGTQLRGRVEIIGTADIPSFAFYKIEMRSADPDSTWKAITAGTVTTQNDLLGVWDVSLVEAGRYYLQLVVTDTAGNAPLPCAIQVDVLPTEG